MKKDPNNHTLTFIAFAFILFCLHSQVHAQVGITAVPFLQINNDARSMGMAGSNVALKNSRSGVHLNPAIFGVNNIIEISSQFDFSNSSPSFGTSWLPGIPSDLHLYTPQLITGFSDFAVAYQYTLLDLGEQIHTDEQGKQIGTFHSYERAHTFSASYDINSHISIGAGVNFIKSDLASGITTTSGQKIKAVTRTSWDVGLYADYPFRKNFISIIPSIGWSITDIGKPVRYVRDTYSDPLPVMMRGGLGLKMGILDSRNLQQIISIGGYISREKVMARRKEDGNAMGPLEAIFNSWGPYTRFNGIQNVTLTLKDQLIKIYGIEVIIFDFLSYRFGYLYEHPLNGDRSYNTFGFGIHYKYFTMDYAKMNAGQRHPLHNTTFVQFTANLPLSTFIKN